MVPAQHGGAARPNPAEALPMSEAEAGQFPWAEPEPSLSLASIQRRRSAKRVCRFSGSAEQKARARIRSTGAASLPRATGAKPVAAKALQLTTLGTAALAGDV